ncbi:MAG: hypothetical protein JNL62_05835 [Bryobacterales bacterium]|nr:hypothetical protein [Bryobacterales bacterium]
MDTLQCAKCKSEKMIPRVRVMDRGQGNSDAGDLSVVTYKSPSAFFFQGAEKMSLYARICGECGYTELFAEYPDDLYERYRQEIAALGGGPRLAR